MKKKKHKPKKVAAKKTPPPEKVIDENPFDFGGLPNRDLKKSLGCG